MDNVSRAVQQGRLFLSRTMPHVLVGKPLFLFINSLSIIRAAQRVIQSVPHVPARLTFVCHVLIMN